MLVALRSRSNSSAQSLVAHPRRCSAGLLHLSRSYASHASSSAPTTYSQHPTARDASGRLLSRVSGPTSEPLLNSSLASFWASIVSQHSSRPALTVRHEPADQHGAASKAHADVGDDESCIRWNYEQMDAHARALAEGMRRIGVKRGDRVAVLMMNNSAMASLQIATSMLGSILVTLNPSYTAKELKKALNHVEASHLFIVPSLRSSDYLENLRTILPSLGGGASASSSAQDAASSSSFKGAEGDATVIQDSEVPSLRRIILVDNLSHRPLRWESDSVLARAGKGFADALRRLNGKGVDYRDILVHGAARQDVEVGPNDVINLQLTSGTTGNPKAVALSSHNLINNGIAIGRTLHFTHNDVLANIPPLFHCFGLTLGNLAAWSHGAHIVYPSEGFNAVRALRASSEERATAIHGVPAHFIAELDVLRRLRKAEEASVAKSDESEALWKALEREGVRRDEGKKWRFDALRTGLTSGSTVPVELMRAIMHELGPKEQTVVYGMTETSPVSFGVDTDAPVERRCETVGRIYPHCHAKLVDPDDPSGKPLPVGSVGELCVGGYLVMQGYFRDQKKTDEVVQRHDDEPDIVWMRSGDLATMDEEGYVKICGRVKDLIIRGGENLTAPGIENCIDELPGVATSAVVAVPDEKMGEAVGVFLGLSPVNREAASKLTPASVRAYVKEHLSGQCAPDWVWVLGKDGVPDAMPTTASGKVQKMTLREWAKDLSENGVGRAAPVRGQPSSSASASAPSQARAFSTSARPRPSPLASTTGRRGFFSLSDIAKLAPGGGSGGSPPPLEHFHESKTLPYTPDELYSIVADVDSYSRFLPYCLDSRVKGPAPQKGEGAAKSVLGELTVGFGAFKESYTSQVDLVPGRKVSATAIPSSSLFTHLETTWSFHPASPSSSLTSSSAPPQTRIDFSLAFAFSNPIYSAVARQVMKRMSDEMMDAFRKRAEEIYGRR